MPQKITKANGHIVQADWNQTNPLEMDYIHNKPDLDNVGITEERVVEIVTDHLPEIPPSLTEQEVIEIINDNLPEIPYSLTESDVKIIINNTIPAGSNVAITRNANGTMGTMNISSTNAGNTLVKRGPSGIIEAGNATLWGSSQFRQSATDKFGLASNKSQLVTIDNINTLLSTFDINFNGMNEAISNLSYANGSSKHKGVIPFANGGTFSEQYYALPITDSWVQDSHFVATDENGQISTMLIPTENHHVASKWYIDSKVSQVKVQTKVSPSASQMYSSSLRFGDLDWGSLWDYEQNVGIDEVYCSQVLLPGDESTTYTITVSNLPDPAPSNSYQYLEPCAVPPKDMTLMDSNCDGYRWLYNAEHGLFHYDYTYANGTYDFYPVNDGPVYIEGPWKIVYGSAYMGNSTEELEFLRELYKDVVITYTCRLEEQNYEGPVHSIELHSDTEVHYDYKVTELTINNLVRCFSEDVAQQWVVSFFAGDSAPIVTLPNNIEITSIGVRNEVDPVATILPIQWIGGMPTFSANKHYMLTFKEMIGSVYATCVELPDIKQ